MSSIADIEAALRRWLAKEGLASYDPYDALSCAWPWSLVRRNRIAARIFTQVIKRCPVNLRPWFGIRRRVLSKSYADLASAALLRHRLGDHPDALDEARAHLESLRRSARPGHAGACWALETPYVTRFTVSPGNDPNLFWTLSAAMTFLEVYELLGAAEDLNLARSSVDFIRTDLGIVDEGESGVWFRYFAEHDTAVFNVAALAGALLVRLARHTGDTELAQLGARALRFVVRHQNDDGSWFYARGPQGCWVDGFHTGYVLEALQTAVSLGADPEVESALERGLHFYLEHLFTPAGLPRYFADATYPIDVQNCAQAIQTLARLSVRDVRLVARAEEVTQAVVEALWLPSRRGHEPAGYFAQSRGRWFVNRVPVVRWGQAPMLLALASLRVAQRRVGPSWESLRTQA